MSQRYRCPNCKTATTLWEGIMISGWRAIDETLTPSGEKEADWVFIEDEGAGGCGECGWEGSLSSLEAVGIDGEPLPLIHPNQLEIT